MTPRGVWPWGIQVGLFAVHQTYFCKINFNFINRSHAAFPFSCMQRNGRPTMYPKSEWHQGCMTPGHSSWTIYSPQNLFLQNEFPLYLQATCSISPSCMQKSGQYSRPQKWLTPLGCIKSVHRYLSTLCYMYILWSPKVKNPNLWFQKSQAHNNYNHNSHLVEWKKPFYGQQEQILFTSPTTLSRGHRKIALIRQLSWPRARG